MEVVFKEGVLFLQGTKVKFGKRSWRKIWMVLYRPSSSGVGRCEIFTVLDNNGVADPKKERKVVRLSDCLSVTPAPKEACPPECTAFYINTVQCTHTLASTSSQDWISALCLLAFQKDPGAADKGDFEKGSSLTMEDNELYSSWKSEPVLAPNQYQVTIRSTEASRRCQLDGDYVLSQEKEAVFLMDPYTSLIIYSWPYNQLRKYGQIEGGFSIEAGRRCESGEGLFIFLTKHGPQIFQAVLKQCCADRKPIGGNRRSQSDQSLGFPPTAVTGDGSENHYDTINDALSLNARRLSLVRSMESWEEPGEDERCHSLEHLNLGRFTGNDMYDKLGRATLPKVRKEKIRPKMEDSHCLYSEVKRVDHLSDVRPEPFSSPPFLPPPPPAVPCGTIPKHIPKPRYQRQTTTNDRICAQAECDVRQTEPQSEDPVSFKQKLAQLICQDLAKQQLPLPQPFKDHDGLA